MLLFWLIIFILSLAILVKSADYFLLFSEKIGRALRIPAFILGIILVSIGTSLPELISSLVAAFKNVTEIVPANIVGSNIFNILCIIGLSSIFAKKIVLERDLINIDLPLLASFTSLLVVITAWDGKITLGEGLVSLLAFLVYLHYAYQDRQREIDEAKEKNKEKLTLTTFLGLLLSGLFIYLGAQYTIKSTIKISELTGIGTSIISLIAIAAGTSLPELIVSVRAAMLGKFEISLGNIIGSNIFNGSLIIGVSSLVRPLIVTPDVLNIGLPFLIIATILFVFSGISKKIHNWEGALLLLIYIVFLAKSFNLF